MTTSKAGIEIRWLKGTIIPAIFKNDNFKKDNALKDFTNNNVKILNVEVKFLTGAEAFMLTRCYRAAITFEQDDGAQKTTNLIVKRTPNVPQETFDAVQFGPLFSNEMVTYQTIMPALEKFAQQTLNIPHFYYGDLGTNYANIVLEDFGVNNWRVAKEKVNLSLGHTLVAIGNLGTFHGIGFALRHKNRHEFDRITKDLKESRYSNEDMHPEWKLIMQTSAERLVIASQKYQPHIDLEFLKRFQQLLSDSILFGRQMVKPVEPLVTLCHGDYLRNNIAFKYSKDDEEPTDSLMFDLQTMRVSSPMLDFATFLSLSCYAAVRYKHFDEIFDEYYNQLIKAYKKHTQNIIIPDFLSRDSFLAEYRRCFPFGISTASHFLKVLVGREGASTESSEEYLTRKFTAEITREETLTSGGEEVDLELSHQMKELFELIQKYNVDIFKGFDYL